MQLSLNELIKLPKVQLHDHLDGGLRPQTIIELAKKYNLQLPATDAKTLGAWFYQESTANGLTRCLNAFAVCGSVMQTEEALERISFEMLEDLANDKIIYAETRFCPYLHLNEGLDYDQVMQSVLRGLERAHLTFGIEFGILICGIRNFDDKINLEMAKLAAKYYGRGVVGFDFAGADIGFPLVNQKATITELKQNHIPFTVHAGEAADISAIIEALDYGATRIGHACQLYNGNDPELIAKTIQRLTSENIHVEINLSSNLGTGVVTKIDAHPAARFWQDSINLALNTDDRLMFNNTLSGEYWFAHNNYGFDFEQIKQMNINAIKSSFAPAATKERILKQLLLNYF